MKEDFRKTFQGIDALIKKMQFHSTWNDVRCEFLVKWAISLHSLNMMPSPKEFKSSVLQHKTLKFAVIFNHNCFSSEVCLMHYNFSRTGMSEPGDNAGSTKLSALKFLQI